MKHNYCCLLGFWSNFKVNSAWLFTSHRRCLVSCRSAGECLPKNRTYRDYYSTFDWMSRWVDTCEDEGAHAGDEPREKTIKRERPDEQAVEELQRPGQQDVQQVGVHHLQLGGGRRRVLLQEPRNHRDHRVGHDWKQKAGPNNRV